MDGSWIVCISHTFLALGLSRTKRDVLSAVASAVGWSSPSISSRAVGAIAVIRPPKSESRGAISRGDKSSKTAPEYRINPCCTVVRYISLSHAVPTAPFEASIMCSHSGVMTMKSLIIASHIQMPSTLAMTNESWNGYNPVIFLLSLPTTKYVSGFHAPPFLGLVAQATLLRSVPWFELGPAFHNAHSP